MNDEMSIFKVNGGGLGLSIYFFFGFFVVGFRVSFLRLVFVSDFVFFFIYLVWFFFCIFVLERFVIERFRS